MTVSRRATTSSSSAACREERVLAYAANFDVALYPRAEDQGIRAAKVAEYMGAGAPIVSYDYEVTRDVAEARRGDPRRVAA